MVAVADPEASLADSAASFRAWLAVRTDELEPFRTEHAEELAPAIERFRPLLRMLWDDGWNRLGWPPEVGGLGGSPVHRFVVAEELAAAGYALPEVMGALEIIAPMLHRYAPHLAARHVAAGMRGDEVWSQGFSEPDAGSDLGSLRTRAVPDGDGFRLTGQKMWSSNGSVSSWSCVLARTGDPDSGYRGLTMFWVDLAAPGVRVVPTKLLNGRSDTSEIFLDDVVVPGDHVIGEVGRGWAAVMYLMQFERGAYAWGRQAEMHTALTELITDHGDEFGPDADQVVGDAYLAMFAVRAQVRGTIAELAAGNDLGPEISVDKILLSTAEQTTTEAVRRLVYPRLELADASDEFAELWRSRWAYSRITTIYGGAGEVQRDLVSERLLGLPRGR
jgi:alkylation response protein AidB-like acyl-CoA dehydrogenase